MKLVRALSLLALIATFSNSAFALSDSELMQCQGGELVTSAQDKVIDHANRSLSTSDVAKWREKLGANIKSALAQAPSCGDVMVAYATQLGKAETALAELDQKIKASIEGL